MRQKTASSNRAGFSLFGVIVIVAVIAILAAVVGPMVFRQMMVARERATSAEMLRIEAGLLDFFEDVGRFPSDAEGLAVLVSDPGIGNWQGPYVHYEHEEPVAQISLDAWNLPYAYDFLPATTPADTATVLIVSGGQNRLIESGSIGGMWVLDGSGDDLRGVVTAARLNREKTTGSETEQDNLALAAQAYFRDNEFYPTDLNQLSGGYLDPGVDSAAIRDEWNRDYILSADNLAVPPTLAITSRGPDGVSGGGDDVVLVVDSVIPGRKTTYYDLAIAQSIVTATTGTDLTGDWTVDRAAFNLASVLETDGWGNPYEEQMSTRTILSAGPDADYFTPADNIPPGVVPDDVGPPPGTGIEYVDGTGSTSGSHCDQFAFDITNTSASDITFSSIVLSWSSPTSYYPKIRINGALLMANANPKIGSGETANLNSPFTLTAGATATVEAQGFVNKASKGGSKVDMSNVDITVEFPDGTTFTFNTGSC